MNTLRAGAARIDISPALGHSLQGWLWRREADRKFTPILARALVLDNGATRVLVLTCDLCIVPEPLNRRLRQAGARAAATPLENVLLCPSHSHYAPDVFPKFWSDRGIQTALEKKYVARLPALFARVARNATRAMRPAQCGCAIGREAASGINSRYRRKDGAINWCGDLTQAVDCRIIDPQVGVVAIRDNAGRAIATLFVYACHANCGEPDGFKAISWDWNGYASQAIEEALGGEALFLPGTCGNIHPRVYGDAAGMGRSLGRAVVKAARSIRAAGDTRLAIVTRTVKLTPRDFAAYDPVRLDAFCNQLSPKDREAGKEFFRTMLAELRRKPAVPVVAPLSVLRLGNAALVCLPGEMFVEFGLAIKRCSPFARTLVAGIVNGYIGYVPTRRAFAEGGYQPSTVTRTAPGSGELLVKQAVRMLGELADDQANFSVKKTRG
jgi:hypothetical protein